MSENFLKVLQEYFNKRKDEDYLAFDDHPLASVQDLMDSTKPAPWDHLNNDEDDEDFDIDIEEE